MYIFDIGLNNSGRTRPVAVRVWLGDETGRHLFQTRSEAKPTRCLVESGRGEGGVFWSVKARRHIKEEAFKRNLNAS